jgi:hypothetical protein
MRQSVKEKNVLKTETNLLHNHYVESQASAVMLAEDAQWLGGTLQVPIKYLPRKPLR